MDIERILDELVARAEAAYAIQLRLATPKMAASVIAGQAARAALVGLIEANPAIGDAVTRTLPSLMNSTYSEIEAAMKAVPAASPPTCPPEKSE